MKDIYSDFDNPSEVAEGGSGSHGISDNPSEVAEGGSGSHGISGAIQAGVSCFRTCAGGSFPYLPGVGGGGAVLGHRA